MVLHTEVNPMGTDNILKTLSSENKIENDTSLMNANSFTLGKRPPSQIKKQPSIIEALSTEHHSMMQMQKDLMPNYDKLNAIL